MYWYILGVVIMRRAVVAMRLRVREGLAGGWPDGLMRFPERLRLRFALWISASVARVV